MKGRKITAMACRIPTKRNASASAFCIAIFFGTSSPSTSEKYDRSSVTRKVETPSTTVCGSAGAAFRMAAVSCGAKFCAADAEEKRGA